jgi:RNA polymerase sigma-70 factor (ECF subfamily)
MGAIPMAIDDPETEHLLRRAGKDDGSAVGRLLERHRQKLRRMIAGRLERRLAARVDPSDIVQEALLDAGQKLSSYARERPIPYYPWLRRLALERLVRWRRTHFGAGKRDVSREQPQRHDCPAALADRLVDDGTSPSAHAVRAEERNLARAALDRLAAIDRRILELRYLDGLSFAEIAAELAIGRGAAKMRHLRALERFNGLIGGPEDASL